MRKFYILFLAFCLLGCAGKQQQRELHSESDLTGLKVGVSAGSTHDLRLSSRTDLTTMQFNSVSDALLAMKQGKIDVFVEDDCSIPASEMKRMGVRIAFRGDEELPCGIPMRKGQDGLRDSLSHFIDSLLSTGEMEKIKERWFQSENPSETTIPDIGPEPKGEPILVGSAIELPPVSYHVGDDWRGFEPELMQRFGRYVGRPVKIELYPISSIIAALQAGKIDMFLGAIYITEERQKTMDFPVSHFSARAGYFVKNEGQRGMCSEADLAGLRVGVTTGSAYDLRLSARNDLTVVRYNELSDVLQALSQGKVDVIAKDNCTVTQGEMKRLGVRVAFYGNDSLPCAVALRKDEQGLRDSLSYFIDSLHATGELQRIVDRWSGYEDPWKVTMPDLGPQPTGKPIHVGSCMDLAPISYQVSGTWLGFEAEMIERFSRYMDKPVKIEYYPFASILPALQTGAIDMIIGGVFVTEDRQKTMDFAHSYFSACTAYLVKDQEESSMGFVSRMREMAYNNLVVEERWRYITGGLWETVKISVLSILFGSLVGAAICWMRMNRRKWISNTAAVYINFMRGIPMLVFLMIMFYVVLAPMEISGTAVAVISFSLVFAAYVSEMFRTAILAVGKGQTEAGLALGLTKWQAFRHVVAPQALHNVMPVYKGEAISLIKNTSIVGYIAIQDLTRASDIIRTRTFDALFPLLIVTVLYFLLAWLLGKALDLTVKNKKRL